MTLARTFRIVFWSTTVFAYVMAVLPKAAAPEFGTSDKVLHMLAFLTLGLLARCAYPRARFVGLAAGLAALGVLIEITQMIPALNRDAELLDLGADVLALLIGLVVGRAVSRALNPRDVHG